MRPGLSTVESLAVAGQFGITLAVMVGLGYLAGQWLDSHLHTSYIFTLVGVILGLAGAATGAVTVYRSALRKNEQRSSARTATSAPESDND